MQNQINAKERFVKIQYAGPVPVDAGILPLHKDTTISSEYPIYPSCISFHLHECVSIHIKALYTKQNTSNSNVGGPVNSPFAYMRWEC